MVTERSLRKAYLRTEVTIEISKGIWVSAFEALEHLPAPIFVITAWNPFSQILSVEGNGTRNRQLLSEIEALGASVHSAVGSSPDGKWSEDSFAVSGIGRRTALNLGLQYEQHAIFEIRKDELRVLGSDRSWIESRAWGSADSDGFQESSDSLSDAVRGIFGLELESDFVRAQTLGWVHEDGLGAPCPICGEDLELFGCEQLSKTRVEFRAMSFVCRGDERIFWPNEVSAIVRNVAKKRRMYLLARSDMDAQKPKDIRTCYVIELSDETGTKSESADPSLPWVYVGETSKTAEERFQAHLAGDGASRWVRKYGIRLLPELFEGQPVLRSQVESKAYEAWLAASLEANGYSVKGGH